MRQIDSHEAPYQRTKARPSHPQQGYYGCTSLLERVTLSQGDQILNTKMTVFI